MKLTYRGIKYESNTSKLEMIDSNVVGKYRGKEFKFRQKKAILIPNSTLRLKYRGVTHLAFSSSWYQLPLEKITDPEKPCLNSDDQLNSPDC
ncbi:MAG: DUF4278 domain-containing protein [Coleofasciculaceae cyanobacterium]